MITFSLPLDPAVISSVAGQTGGVVGSSNVAGTLYVSVPILDPEFIQANLAFAQANTSLNVAQSALITAQAAYNFANTISGESAADNVARIQANAAFIQANAAFAAANAAGSSNTVIAAFNQANAAFAAANVGNTFVYTGGTVSGNVRINGTLTVTGNTTIENINITNISVNTTDSIVTTGNITASYVYSNGSIVLTSEPIANAVNNYAVSAYTQANATNQYATSAYAQANATNTYATTAYNQANAANSLAQSAYNKANTGGVISGNLVINGVTTLLSTLETVYPIASPSSTVTLNMNNGTIFYLTGLTGNVTAAYTNVPITANTAIGTVINIVQGSTGYIANAISINGNTQTIKWVSNTIPGGTANKNDVISFTFITASNTANIIVLGSLNTYG